MNEVVCLETKAQAEKALAKEAPTRAELQSLIEKSADNCVGWQHGEVVAPICAAWPDACTGTLEEEVRK